MLIKILTLNVMQYSKIASLRKRTKYLSQWIQDKGIDIVLTQEGSVGIGSLFTSPFIYDSNKYLYKLLNVNGHSSKCFPNVPFFMYFTCGIGSKYPIVQRHYIKNCKSGKELRSFPVVLIETPVGNIVACSLHLSSNINIDEQFNQFKQMAEPFFSICAKHKPVLSIIGGDFNRDFTKNNGFLGYLDDNFMFNTLWDGHSFNVENSPYKNGSPSRIDYIFTNKWGVAHSSIVFNGIDGNFISDHCGIYTEIEI